MPPITSLTDAPAPGDRPVPYEQAAHHLRRFIEAGAVFIRTRKKARAKVDEFRLELLSAS
jgi:hypothetical protein